MSAELDVVVVGAGAAGIAAARRLGEAGLSLAVIEAGDRVGGRAWTIRHEGLPIDLGCGWLHSAERNPWTALAPDLGFTIDRTLPPWGRQFRNLGFPAADQMAARAAFTSFEQRLRRAPAGTDRAADLLEEGGTWNPYLEAVSSYINGTDLKSLSIRDYLAFADADTGVNWRVIEGYGALIARAASGLPISLGMPVSAIEADQSQLAIVTGSGTIRAGAAIITVSTDVLAAGIIKLPAALDDRIEAASRLPLGLADKVSFAIDRPDDLEPDTQVLGNPHTAKTGSYHLRPFGRPLIEGFICGAAARELEASEDMVAFAQDELAGLFGAGIRRRLKPVAQTRWAKSPFIRGSYSHALPGCVEARAILAKPGDERIFFAGEACSTDDFSTAHGAYQTGLDAAEGVLSSHHFARNGGHLRRDG
ncbi:flavin monoamine oxidase family protein [Bosea sp. 2RAB26]|uniref:flavin monoamine oxidase family protein n=1 Tax=Bosea sp. 2RAB26 TaxID=3237476 RepID=UPI003F914BE0